MSAKREKRIVEVGGHEYTLAPLSGRRAFAAFRLSSQITDKAGDVQSKMARYSRAYARENALILTPSTSWMPGLPRVVREMTKEDWERCGGIVEIPQPPSTMQVIGAVLPDVLAAAEEEVLRLLALTIVSNDDYGNAVVTGTEDRLIATKRDDLLKDADLDDLVELIDAVVGHLGDQLRGLVKKAGNLRRLLGAQEPETEQSKTETEPSAAATDGTKPDSSTGSPEPTAGDPDRSSTESPTSSS
jgi:hypothetical protein